MTPAVAPSRTAATVCHAVEAMATRFEIVLEDGRTGIDLHAIADVGIAFVFELRQCARGIDSRLERRDRLAAALVDDTPITASSELSTGLYASTLN